jgi:hypothetical protein
MTKESAGADFQKSESDTDIDRKHAEVANESAEKAEIRNALTESGFIPDYELGSIEEYWEAGGEEGDQRTILFFPFETRGRILPDTFQFLAEGRVVPSHDKVPWEEIRVFTFKDGKWPDTAEERILSGDTAE